MLHREQGPHFRRTLNRRAVLAPREGGDSVIRLQLPDRELWTTQNYRRLEGLVCPRSQGNKAEKLPWEKVCAGLCSVSPCGACQRRSTALPSSFPRQKVRQETTPRAYCHESTKSTELSFWRLVLSTAESGLSSTFSCVIVLVFEPVQTVTGRRT